MKILLLDDDAFFLKVLNIQLRAFGLGRRGFVEVVCCESGPAALDHLASDPNIALVFCDLQMPDMDGVECVRRMVQQGYTGALVLISGEDPRVLDAAERLARAHNLNVLGALQKPVQPPSLLALLDRVIPQSGSAMSQQPAYPVDEVRGAVERGEVINYYQPKIDLKTGDVVGVEALARWQHPVDGIVLPDRFIGVAESNGLIDDLGTGVLRTAMQDTVAWREAGYPLQVAVNVSMSSLATIDFPDRMLALAKEIGVQPSDVVLEVTETGLMDQPTQQLDVLTRLRLKRVCLSIDDFGTGYSCLSQLRDLPFEEVKIDRSFVHGVSRNASLMVIIDSIISLVRQLGGVRVVAEGIEDRADLETVREAGCDFGQGFYIARPMPAEDVLPWLERWRRRWPELAG